MLLVTRCYIFLYVCNACVKLEFHFTDILLTSWLALQRHTVSKQTAIVPPLKPKGLLEELRCVLHIKATQIQVHLDFI